MKNSIKKYLLSTVLLLAILIAILPSFKSRGKEIPPQDTFADLQKGFLNPGKDYESAPLWVWNTKVTKKIIDSMMLTFKKNAFGGVFVHPRPGLITEYLSDDWFKLFQYTVDKGKQLGLNVWIYDENSYPSGFAGGLVNDQMPESYNQGQMLHLTKTNVLNEKNSQNLFVCLKEENGIFRNITSSINSEKGKTGNYFLFNKENYQKNYGIVGPEGFSYVDLMVKGVTEKFLDITMSGYEKAAGKEFGKTIKGIFSDEPSIPAWGSNTIRWTPDLFTTFKKRWGYDLELNLPSLFEEVGDWKKIRHNYVEVLSQLFIDRWSRPMQEYTQKHGLIWTGHYWEHGWPNANDVPDNMAMYAFAQQPGIDMLFNQFDETSPNAQFGNIRAVKELRSAANQLGKKRTLSETYGGAGWEVTFKDMKRLGDWEYVLGINFLNQHLSWMTLTGARKYDYPQSFSYHNPWFAYYKSLNQYFARLSFALSQGRQLNDILIIEPTTSAWMYFVHDQKNKGLEDIGNNFQSFVTQLEKAQVEYDLGSENIIKDHGKVENGKFIVGERVYKTVVIPPGMENIDGPAFQLLKEFIEQGGKVIQFEKLQRIDGAINGQVDYFNVAKKNVLHFDKLGDKIIEEQFSADNFKIAAENADSIGGDLYHQRRIFKDGQLVFLSNASMTNSSRGSMNIKGKDALLLDPVSGEITDYTEQEKNGKTTVHFDIPPAGSLLFFVSEKKQTGFKLYKIAENKISVKSSATKIVRPRENTLMIDFCDVSYGDTSLKDTHVGVASKSVFRHYGFEQDPWDHQVQFKNAIVSRDTFSKGTGFSATYHFDIDNIVNYKNFRAVVEQGNLWNKITVNGTTVKPQKNQWWLDRSFGVLEIGKYLKTGENSLTIKADPMSVFAEIEPVYILGDFNLESSEKGFKIVPAQPLEFGSWNQQGLPLYGQSVSYIKEFNCENPNTQFEVQLGKWAGTVVSVEVNGKDAGVIWAEPGTLNISKYVKKGINSVKVTVVGSLKNLLGPHHKSPKPGLVSPQQWKNITSYPAGNKYETLDYGLMEDFKIVKFDLKD
jgi:hypothetical protein